MVWFKPVAVPYWERARLAVCIQGAGCQDGHSVCMIVCGPSWHAHGFLFKYGGLRRGGAKTGRMYGGCVANVAGRVAVVQSIFTCLLLSTAYICDDLLGLAGLVRAGVWV